MGYTLQYIAGLVNGHLIGDAGVLIEGVNSLDKASKEDISFFADSRYKAMLKDSRAGALLVAKKNGDFSGPQILVPNPVVAFAGVAALFVSPPSSRAPGVSEQAIVHETSRIGKGVCIHPLAYVGEGAVVGDEVVLFPGVYIGDRVRVGARTLIYPNVTILKDCLIGKGVIIHAGTVIGSDGFGYVWDGAVHVKIPQLGIVQIDDNVEIGANNTIDRATLGKTWIQSGVKTDNLVHIAHNVNIGENTIVVAQTAIGGSVHIGRQVVIGGHVSIADHLEIGDRAMIGSKSGVAKSIPPGDVVSGIPTMPHRLWLRTRTLIPRLPEFNDRIKDLEKRIQELEQRLRD